ncbi:MAG TPA: MraY family glycosyltransferase [Hyphomonadaceae bacterium]|nr:MraY family glycosyltransferase [Hyphomonadaceae bacterium]
MGELLRTLLAFLTAAVLALGLCRLVINLRVMDAPTEARKTQKTAVPSAGGLGFALAAILSAIAVSLLTGWTLGGSLIAGVSGAVAYLAVGFADDTLHINARWRLGIMTVIAVAMTLVGARADIFSLWPGLAVELPLVVAILGSALWLVVLVNAVNFMDGANGVSMGIAAIAATGLATASALIGLWNIAFLSAALAGGLAGFLAWNVSGRLYAGDTGALFAGAMLGALSLELVRLRPDLLFVPPILLMPYLSDVLLTLIWRARHGKKLFEAHRDHVYQIAIKAGLRHWQVAAVHAFLAFNSAVFAVISALVGGPVPPIAFLVLLALSVWLHIWVRRLGVKAGLVGANIP